ncbi:hypothetical protein BDA99DRAFT_540845 [Phascolomyces articulosus]|uniref:Uncharacterized protein n=1 Tax=Phascolomyces articulosus TaxID=60185 RepID=A0AAD5K2G0_9FUNG|nr:hypothetical protein BDA99DRAFT_540845 [Phascolomyces articulosus]
MDGVLTDESLYNASSCTKFEHVYIGDGLKQVTLNLCYLERFCLYSTVNNNDYKKMNPILGALGKLRYIQKEALVRCSAVRDEGIKDMMYRSNDLISLNILNCELVTPQCLEYGCTKICHSEYRRFDILG